jgi:hypothetical protein
MIIRFFLVSIGVKTQGYFFGRMRLSHGVKIAKINSQFLGSLPHNLIWFAEIACG